MRDSAQDAEVIDLLRAYDRTVVRLSELGVDVSDRNPTAIQVRSVWKRKTDGDRVRVQRVWFASYLLADNTEARGWSVSFRPVIDGGNTLVADADWFRDYYTETFD